MYKEIVISEELAKQLEALQDSKIGKHFEWTPEKDAILLKYWNIKKQSDVCNILGEQKTLQERGIRG